MSDARNDYPRLCWCCLAVIKTSKDDYANLNYGGTCARCAATGADEMPFLRRVVEGHNPRMNSILERDDLLKEVQAMGQ